MSDEQMKIHAELIADAIQVAEESGFDVTIENQCCGCSKMTLEISAKEDTDGSNSRMIMRSEL